MEKTQNKSKNTKMIAIIAIVVVVAIVIIGGIAFFANDYLQRAKIGEEMEKVNTSGTVDTEIKTSGKYAEVEKALKDYIVEYQNIAKEIAEQYQNGKFTTILSADNYDKDGPEFVESKKLISDAKAKGEEVKTKLAEMVTEEFKENRATECGLTGKYKELFKDSIQLEDELKEVNETIDNVNSYLDTVDEIFDLLKENKDKWQVKDDKIEFNSLSVMTKYNSLVTKVNTAAAKLQ